MPAGELGWMSRTREPIFHQTQCLKALITWPPASFFLPRIFFGNNCSTLLPPSKIKWSIPTSAGNAQLWWRLTKVRSLTLPLYGNFCLCRRVLWSDWNSLTQSFTTLVRLRVVTLSLRLSSVTRKEWQRQILRFGSEGITGSGLVTSRSTDLVKEGLLVV